jgi:DNA polymerase III alpha subunit (gram-positive type)
MRPKVHKRYIIEEGKRKKVFFDDKGGWGFQTDIELKACPECHEKYEKEKKSFTDV